LAFGGAFCSRKEEIVQLIKPTVIETLSIGWLRAMTRPIKNAETTEDGFFRKLPKN
jgi:hypothetical protein